MGRPINDDLNKSWKILLPATLAGKMEFMLRDPIHNKPIYGARAELIEALLLNWLDRESGLEASLRHPVPSLLELREKANNA